jgi:DNA-binding NtrC family response regulator
VSAGRILIIDDDDRFRALLRIMLATAGYDIQEAADGAVGMTRYDPQLIDVVITDILMPQKEGLETIQALKKRNPQVKIIAMSGSGEGPHGHLTVAMLFGAARILRKPFTRAELLTTITEVLAMQ